MPKRKRRVFRPVCPDCQGRSIAVPVTVTNLNGTTAQGQELRRVTCATCESTGHVAPTRVRACCCSGPREDRCRNCADSYNGLHTCTVATDEELDRELALMAMPSPQKATPSPEMAARVAEMSNGVGERSPHRGTR